MRGRKRKNRILALLLLVALSAAQVSFPARVSASNWQEDQTTTVRSLIINLVRENLVLAVTSALEAAGDTSVEEADTSAVSDDDIIREFESAYDSSWDGINLRDLVQTCVGLLTEAGVDANHEDTLFKSYAGITLPLDYTLGDLMVDWAREQVSFAAMLSDEDLKSAYAGLIGQQGTPYITLYSYAERVTSLAGEMTTPKSGEGSPLLKTNEYITYREYLTNGNIVPSGTLFIGTWMMDAQAVNSTMYTRAVRSMAEDDQQIMYYKSELAGGRWRDISSATSLSAILPAGEDVADKELLDFYISVYVGADGMPIDPKTGQYVDIFSMSDPYELDTLPELKAIRLNLDSGNLKSYRQGARGSAAYTYDRVRLFFAHDQKYTPTAGLDPQWLVNYWKTAATSGKGQLRGFDFNSGSTLKEYNLDGGISVSYFGISKEYGGDMPLIDMLQTDQEYGHNITYYMHEGGQNGGWRSRRYWKWWTPGWRRVYVYDDARPVPEVKGSVVYTGSSSSILPWYLMYDVVYADSLELSLRGSGMKANAPIVSARYTTDLEKRLLGDIDDATLNTYATEFKRLWAASSSIRDAETDDWDDKLSKLANIYLPLKQAGLDEEASRAMLLQDKVDSARRARAYYNLVINEDHNYGMGAPLNNLFSQVAYGYSGFGRSYDVMAQDYVNSSDDGTLFEPDSAMMDIVGDAVEQATSSYNSYNANALTDGDTVAQKFEYEISMDIIENAAGGISAVQTSLQELSDLDNILEGTIRHKDRELSTLSSLQTTADARFTEQSMEGAGEDYTDAANDPDTTQETLRNLLQTQKSDFQGTISEVQQFIRARVTREAREPAIAFIDERIDWADGLRSGVSGDAYGPYALEAIDAHITWLKNLRKAVLAEGDEDDEDPELDKAELNLERLDLLDDDDLDGIDSLDKAIDDADQDIDAARQRNLDILNGDGTASDKAEAEGELTGMDEAKVEILDDILSDIENDDYDRITQKLDAAGDLGINLDDIPGTLEASGAPKSVINYAEDAAARAKTSPFYDDGTRDDGGGDNGEGNEGNEGADGDGSGTGGNGGNGGGDGGTGGGSGNETGDVNGPGGGPEDGSGEGDNSDTDGTGGTGTGGTGGSGGSGGGGGGSGSDGAGGGDGAGLSDRDIDSAIGDVLDGDGFDDLSDADKAALTAALNKFADDKDDDELRKKVKDLLNELLAEGNGFIYRQYLADLSQEYVSMAAVDKCRAYTRLRCVTIGDEVTMSQITGGSASYMFTIGSTTVEKNNGKTSEMATRMVTQSDPSIRGSRTAQYPYITEDASALYLSCTCEYIPDTEWAILIAPSMSQKVIALLESLNALYD